ncbi:MAG: hypothetical protein ACXWWC_02420 [Chitinophagaceae bacterium]
MNYLSTILIFSLLPSFAEAQNYTATNGSSYIGSLNVHNNPASIVNSPLKWDITLFGLQDKHTTNTVKIFKYSLLSNPAKSQYQVSNGQFRRYADLNANLNLANARIALNKRSAIAFGANIRSYLTLTTSPYTFIDTISRFGHFFLQNEGTQNLNADMAGSSWAELYATYGQTVFDNEYSRLNAAITLKLNRGLSGAFASLANGNFIRNGAASPVEYLITNAALDFGYSSNYDSWDNKQSFKENVNNFFSFTEGGGSFDIGFEWLVKLQTVSNALEEEIYFDYDWKIGLALSDMGYGQYHFGKYSTSARDIKTGVTDVLLDQAFDSTVNTISEFRDNLSTVFSNVKGYGGKFRINHPGRLALNADKFIKEAFYVNAGISVSLSSLSSGPDKKVKDMNVLTLTPRWETRKIGFFLPFYYNNRNQFWVGGAVRLGPLLFGIHNWSNIFSTKKIQRGGGYLAILIKAADFTGDKADKRLDCFK